MFKELVHFSPCNTCPIEEECPDLALEKRAQVLNALNQTLPKVDRELVFDARDYGTPLGVAVAAAVENDIPELACALSDCVSSRFLAECFKRKVRTVRPNESYL